MAFTTRASVPALTLCVLLIAFNSIVQAQFSIRSVSYPRTFAPNVSASFEDVIKFYFSDEQVQDGILVVEFQDFDVPNNSSECKSSDGKFLFFDMLERSVPDDACLEVHKEAHFCNANKPKKNTVIVDLSAHPPLIVRGAHRLNMGVCRGSPVQTANHGEDKSVTKVKNGNGKANGKKPTTKKNGTAKKTNNVTGRGFNATITLYKKNAENIDVNSFDGTLIQPSKFYSKV